MNAILALPCLFCDYPERKDRSPMRSADVERIIALVKEKTGCPVTTSFQDNLGDHSRMQTASAAAPVHLVLLDPDYSRMSNFLVAIQCAMILVKWADPTHVPDFGFTNDDLQSLAKKLCTDKPITDGLIAGFVRPLFTQLVSEPSQIMAAEWLWKDFPGLRDEQRLYMTMDIRQVSGVLAPPVKDTSPKGVYEVSVAMGAAYALWWAGVDGSKIALLPYEATGYLKKGQELLDAFNSVPADDTARWPRIVDLWAAKLNLTGCYRWKIRTA